MKQAIVDYKQDEENHWIAILECGHTQHVRHQPPFFNREWTQTELGRNNRLGFKLNCKLCDEKK